MPDLGEVVFEHLETLNRSSDVPRYIYAAALDKRDPASASDRHLGTPGHCAWSYNIVDFVQSEPRRDYEPPGTRNTSYSRCIVPQNARIYTAHLDNGARLLLGLFPSPCSCRARCGFL